MSAKGHVLHQFSLTIDTVDYSCEVFKCAQRDEGSQVQRQAVACGQEAIDTSPEQWVLDVEYAVDWNADSLYRVLLANAGATAAVEWEPDPVNAPGVTVTATVHLVNGTNTGTIGQWDNGVASLPCTAKPVVVDPVVP